MSTPPVATLDSSKPSPPHGHSDTLQDMPVTADAAQPTSNAADRLASSRASLRGALMAIAHPPAQPPLFAGGLGDVGSRLTARARSLPGVGLAIDSAEAWWHAHPLRMATAAAARVSGPLLAPVARRRPKSLLLTAFGLGAALVLIKPWRLLFRRAVMFGVVSQIVSHAVRGRSSKSWMPAILGALGPRRTGAKPAAAAPR